MPWAMGEWQTTAASGKDLRRHMVTHGATENWGDSLSEFLKYGVTKFASRLGYVVAVRQISDFLIDDLLREVSEAHHEAFASVNGDDPNWAEWYSRWLLENTNIRVFLTEEISVRELALALDEASKVPTKDPNWKFIYMMYLLRKFS